MLLTPSPRSAPPMPLLSSMSVHFRDSATDTLFWLGYKHEVAVAGDMLQRNRAGPHYLPEALFSLARARLCPQLSPAAWAKVPADSHPDGADHAIFASRLVTSPFLLFPDRERVARVPTRVCHEP